VDNSREPFSSSDIGNRELLYRNIRNEPFVISGFAWYHKTKRFCRLPEAIPPEINAGAVFEAASTAGGMVRFKTNSDTIAIWAELASNPDAHPHMPGTGSSGFDLYIGKGTEKRFVGSEEQVAPPAGSSEVKALMACGLGDDMKECTVNFPLYNGVNKVSIGLNSESHIERPSPFAVSRPLLFYGSSITQGGCASHPGNAYPAIIARRLDADHLNLGFSAGAKGEPAMAKLIASLEMSVFIFDYDHNAMTVEQLADTHEPFYQIIRKAHPELPIVMVSRPDIEWDPELNFSMRAVIRTTYDNAINNGDRRVFFIDGETLFGTRDRDACTVDGRHPNDLGFMRMAETIYPVVREALSLSPSVRS